jgi:opacity protein-like surface antigen
MGNRGFVLAAVAFGLLADADRSRAADSERFRGYLALRVGGAYFLDADSAGVVDLESPAAEALGGAVVGVNLSRHWGVEVAGEATETRLEAIPGGREVGEYTVVSVAAQVRWRYPVLENRLTPYLFLGGGMGFAEVNDKDLDSPVSFGRDNSPLGTVGGGLEYFVANNIALGIELKHVYAFETRIKVAGERRPVNLDSLIYTAGLRIFFPEIWPAVPAEPPPPAGD